MKSRPNARNGTPSPIEKAASRTAPSVALPPPRASVRIAASVGPTHGIQAIANATPVSADVARSPLARGMRSRRSAASTRGSGSPAITTAAAIRNAPAAISSVRRFSVSSVFGLIFLVHQTGSALGSWLAGALFETTGGYGAAFTAAGVLLFGAAVVALRIDTGGRRLWRAVPAATGR